MNIKLNTIQVMFYYNQPIHFDNEYKQYIDECVFYYSLYDDRNAKSAITRGTYSVFSDVSVLLDRFWIQSISVQIHMLFWSIKIQIAHLLLFQMLCYLLVYLLYNTRE